jgi:endoglycosylceramidase
VLRTAGRQFVDPAGRIVLLRGVNLSGDAKVPPFLPLDDPAALDPLPELGLNCVRLLFVWEAFEPERGAYDEQYLGRMVAIARAAWRRGLYVVVDFHQDGLSRWTARGCGAGFPAWALSPRVRPAEPDNGCGCKTWVARMVLDPNIHRALADFYADVHGVRTAYLSMVGRAAAAFADCPGVIGYDLLNEPWGHEANELAPLFRDAAAAVRAQHPDAILFVAGHGTTSCGAQTRLPRPEFDNFAYAPHYYSPLTVARGAWSGSTRPLDRAFATMQAKAEEWDVPLWLGEFGTEGTVKRGGDFVAAVYARLDAAFASGTQWNYTPRWDEHRHDGWNGEDYSILDNRARPRAGFRPRPYPQKVAGASPSFAFQAGATPVRFDCRWDHRPQCGVTEIFAPRDVFPSGSTCVVEPPDATVSRDESRQLWIVRAPRAEAVRITLVAPAP